jgi:hypothetical protein
MGLVELGDYWLVRLVLQRGLGAIYLIAFLVAASQFRPLAGEDGLLPLDRYVERTDPRASPSLFYVLPSDRAIGLAAWLGGGLALLVILGVPQFVGTVPTAAAFFLLWTLYLSFVNAGQLFYGYGWETMLLEAGFLAIFLGAAGTAPPDTVIWLFRWLLFRMMFGSGLIKLRQDPCWRDLSCLDVHYETQPMPNPVSWYAQHLPDAVHRLGVIVTLLVEVVVPFLYFAPQPFATVAGLVTIGFQAMLILTGNFAWWNWLTALLAVSTFDDAVLSAALPVTAPTTAPLPIGHQIVTGLVALVVLGLSYYPVRNLLSRRQAMNASYDPFKLVNTYGAFGSITTDRFQLVIEGTNVTDPEEDDWRAYTFKGQPVRLDERPPQWAPYHLRLDWQLWFAAMSPSPRRHGWFLTLMEKLLAGDEQLEKLLESDPFPDEPPRFVRALRYKYEFTAPADRAETGRWWGRELQDVYVLPVSLQDLRSSGRGRQR